MEKKFEFNSKLLTNILGEQYRNIYNTTIFSVSTLNNPESYTLIFAKTLDDIQIQKLQSIEGCIILINKKYADLSFNNNCVIYVEKPRKEYARILNFILNNQGKNNRKYSLNKNGYYIGENVFIGDSTTIEPLVFIDHDVNIGVNCVIKSGAKIRKNTIIGDNCIIKENCVIGDEGFGMERDVDKIPYRIPHLGGVIIGNNVEVGALVSIAQGTIEPTVIEDYVKIDDCAFIAHNCRIGKGTYIIANAEISGSVQIGEYSWIGPSTAVINGISIGENVTTGIGTIVIKNVQNNSIIAGNPADTTQNLRKMKEIKKQFLKNLNN